jgi:RNA polymerase sigma factor (sigma-70 family)
MYCTSFFPAEGLASPPGLCLERIMLQTIPTSKPQTSGAAHEELLVRVGRHKDRAAFVELFSYYAPRVKSYLLKHGAPEPAAEEIVQNTFVAVWEKASGYDPARAAASTWIFTIARNKRIDALRRDRFIEINSDSQALASAVSATAEDYADSGEIEKLHSAMAALPEEQARLLRMAFFEDKSHQAISDETRLPLGTVKSRLRLAMDKLRRLLKQGGRENAP